MTGFSAEWLALREPFDHAARAAAWPSLGLCSGPAPLRRLAVPGNGGLGGAALEVIDLACGSGANMRALAPRLGPAQRWQLIDHDAALLAALPAALAGWARQQGYRYAARGDALYVEGPRFSAELQPRQIDLAASLAMVDFAGAALITGSALLDLVSAEWVDALIAHCRPGGAAMLFALNVDGRGGWDPADPDDPWVQALYSQDMHRDKGFGPALGEHAVAVTTTRLRAVGDVVHTAASDWVIDGTTDAPGLPAVRMQSTLVDGMAAAALGHAPQAAGRLEAWQRRRQAQCATSRLRVGHTDLFAYPMPPT